MDLGLKGRVAAVAAASQGLGFACALELAREGAEVAICSRDRGRIDAAASKRRERMGRVTVTGRDTLTLGEDLQRPRAAVVRPLPQTYGDQSDRHAGQFCQRDMLRCALELARTAEIPHHDEHATLRQRLEDCRLMNELDAPM